MQQSGLQLVLIEDSFSYIYGLIGKCKLVSEYLLFELVIVVGMVKVVLVVNLKLQWDVWIVDYGWICDLIVEIYLEQFYDFNQCMFQFGGFYCGNVVYECIWKIDSGKVEFIDFSVLFLLGVGEVLGCYYLIMLCFNDQFNIIIYGYSDCLCGLEGLCEIVLINLVEMECVGFKEGDVVSLVGDVGDDVQCEVNGLIVVVFNFFDGCFGGYYLEMNVLVLLWYYDQVLKMLVFKGVLVCICCIDM